MNRVPQTEDSDQGRHQKDVHPLEDRPESVDIRPQVLTHPLQFLIDPPPFFPETFDLRLLLRAQNELLGLFLLLLEFTQPPVGRLDPLLQFVFLVEPPGLRRPFKRNDFDLIRK